jgi:allantoin racemase
MFAAILRGDRMRIHVINPNTTSSLTLKIGAAAKAASPGVEVTAANSDFGPPSIEGYFDEAFSVPGLIRKSARRLARTPSSWPLFDDAGLDAARCATEAPVVGIGEAAFHFASLSAARFSVVATLSRSITPIEHNLEKCGLAVRCAHSSRRGSGAGARGAGLEGAADDRRRKSPAR